MRLSIFAAQALAVALAHIPTTATAIECDRQYQIVNGARIATPYCGDQLLGQLARQSGIQVSDEDIRRNATTKTNICARIGQDNQLRTICANHFPNPGSND